EEISVEEAAKVFPVTKLQGGSLRCNYRGPLTRTDNALVGNIHESSFGQLPLLRTVSPSGNQLTGQIPPSLGSLKNLLQLTLTRNSFVATRFPVQCSYPFRHVSKPQSSHRKNPFPDWPPKVPYQSLIIFQNLFLHLQNMWYLNLSNSESQILCLAPLPRRNPYKIYKPDSLTFIDLSDNHFMQGISNFFPKLSSLQNVQLSNNQLKFDLTKITLPSELSSLDLYSNLLFGSLSRIINGQTSSFLITCTIPTSLGLLQKLQWLNLSINGISGKIPISLLGIEQLRHANFKVNKLCGEIPQGRPFNVFQATAYAHSLCLCGKPLPHCKGKKLGKKGQQYADPIDKGQKDYH
ncbi:hypothetical protein RJ639_024764, partial [Escallonia herrerae]